MFNGSKEDKAIALEIFDNQYEDKDIIDPLMCKALCLKQKKCFDSC